MSKLRAVSVVLVAGTCLLADAAVPADAAKRKCAKKAEKSGCVLPKGATYSATMPNGGGAFLSVDARSWSVTITATDRGTGGGPCNPRFSRTGIELQGRPKVGRTYVLKQDTRRVDRGVGNALRVDGKVKITSAKRATFSGTFSSQRSFRDNVFPPCERSLALKGARKD